MTPIDQLPETRRAVLMLIKQRGHCTLAELADELRITREGARQQLLQLERVGWVEAEQEPATGKAGRPAALYRLTPTGDHLFPKRYDALAVTLIDAVTGVGPDATQQMLARVVDMKVAEWAPRLVGLSFDERVKALRGLYLDEDAFMEVQRDGADWLLIERNCPYLDVARKRPALCSVTVNVLARLLNARITREQRLQEGHGRCAFRATRLDTKVARTFRFEAPL